MEIRTAEEFLSRLELRSQIKTICYAPEDTCGYPPETVFDFKEWKKIDHYKLLGLVKRHEATQEEIKKAYKKIILTMHPDKIQTGSQKEKIQVDERFKCFQKAYELLSDNKKRKQFDSVDPLFDETIPMEATPEMFYKVFEPVFRRNSRFSKIQPVPQLGTDTDDKKTVERFYGFWVNFQTTRTFEYHDKEESNAGDNRDERRYIAKKNKAEREKRANSERKRLVNLVDAALKADPRVKRFKQQNKQRPEQGKGEDLRTTFVKYLTMHMFFDKKMSHYQFEKEAEILKMVIKSFSEETIRALHENFMAQETIGKKRELFIGEIRTLGVKQESRSETMEKGEMEKIEKSSWKKEDVTLLIQAVNKFPGGVLNRWKMIANYVTEHTKTKSRFTEKDVLEVVAKLKGGTEKKKEEPGKWTLEEQKLLEEGMRLHSHQQYAVDPVSRWRKIAEHVKSRTGKECLLRAREIAANLSKRKP